MNTSRSGRATFAMRTIWKNNVIYTYIFAIDDFDIYRAIGVIVVAILEVCLEPVWKKKHFLYFEKIVFQKSVNHHHPQCLKLTAKLY